MKRNGGNLNVYYKVKEDNLKRLYNSNFMIFWKKQNYKDRKTAVLARLRRKVWKGRTQRIFRAVKLLCMILKWWILVNTHLSKFIKFTLRVNPNGLWEIMMSQYKFISWDKCTTLVGNVDNKGDYACVGQGLYGESLYLTLNFIVNLNLL